MRGILKDGRIFACQKMRRKKQNPFLLGNAFNVSVVDNLEAVRHFVIKSLDMVQKPL